MCITKGDKLCDEAERALDVLPGPAKAKSLTEAGRYLDKPLPILRKLITGMKALPAPLGDEALVTEINGAQEATLGKMQQMRDAAVANQASRVIELEKEFGDAATVADAKMVAYGFTSCGN